MTLTEIVTHLTERNAIPASRLKDLKTSTRYLAQALQADGPDTVHDAESLARRRWSHGRFIHRSGRPDADQEHAVARPRRR